MISIFFGERNESTMMTPHRYDRRRSGNCPQPVYFEILESRRLLCATVLPTGGSAPQTAGAALAASAVGTPANATTMTLTASATSPVLNQTITFVAVVTAATNTPEGSVNFAWGSNILGNAPLVNG